jgi:hypothetical protein
MYFINKNPCGIGSEPALSEVEGTRSRTVRNHGYEIMMIVHD